MKISPINGITGPRIAGTDRPAHSAATPTAAASAPASAAPANTGTGTGTTATGVLQSALLQPALAALRALPDNAIDQARVAALRDALAAGALPFDAAKLAGLIQRFHGGRP